MKIFKNTTIIFVLAVFIFQFFSSQANAIILLPPAIDITPNLNIDFSFDGIDIQESGIYPLTINEIKPSIYTYSQNIQGDVYAEIYQGVLNNAQLVSSIKTDNSGTTTAPHSFTQTGDYFVVVYQISNQCQLLICFPTTQQEIQDWLANGKAWYIDTSYDWGIINFTITEQQIPTCCSNVVFLPGLQGSRLYKQQMFENKLWEPNTNSDIEKLYLTDQGESIDSSIYTEDIVDEALGFNTIFPAALPRVPCRKVWKPSVSKIE